MSFKNIHRWFMYILIIGSIINYSIVSKPFQSPSTSNKNINPQLQNPMTADPLVGKKAKVVNHTHDKYDPYEQARIMAMDAIIKTVTD